MNCQRCREHEAVWRIGATPVYGGGRRIVAYLCDECERETRELREMYNRLPPMSQQ